MTNARDIVLALMKDVQGLAKKDLNKQQGFNFRGIDAVMNAVGPALRNAGGFIVPEVLAKESETLPARNGGSLNTVRITVAYSVHGSEGDPIVGVVAAEAFDSGDKATAKAMSVAYRTFLLQLLCLPTDEPDPDSYTYEVGEAAAPVSKPSSRRDWMAEVNALEGIDAARVLFAEARQKKAGAAVLEAIQTKVATLAPAADN